MMIWKQNGDDQVKKKRRSKPDQKLWNVVWRIKWRPYTRTNYEIKMNLRIDNRENGDVIMNPVNYAEDQSKITELFSA